MEDLMDCYEEGKEKDGEIEEVEKEEEENVIFKRPLILIDMNLMKERYENVKIELDDDDEEMNNNDNIPKERKKKEIRKIIKILEPINFSGKKRKEGILKEDDEEEEENNKKSKNGVENDKEEEEEKREITETLIMIENSNPLDDSIIKNEKLEKQTEIRGEFNCLKEKDIVFIFGYVEGNNSIFLDLFFPTLAAMKYLNCVQITSAMIKYEDEIEDQPKWVQNSISNHYSLSHISSIPYNETTKRFRLYWKGFAPEFSFEDHKFNIAFANVQEKKVIEYKKSNSIIPSISIFASFSINTTFTC